MRTALEQRRRASSTVAHALAAAARHRLHQQRIANARRHSRAISAVGRAVVERLVGAGHDRHAGARSPPRARRSCCPSRDRLGRRTDERQPGIAARACERLVLREKAVAGMHRVGAGAARSVDHRVDAEIAFGRPRSGRCGRLVGVAHVQRARSQSEYTATDGRPISRHARMMRTAISPRLATRTFMECGFDCMRRPSHGRQRARTR